MYLGDREALVRRKSLTILQDETKRVLDATRELSLAYTALLKKDRKTLNNIIERIRRAEDDVEAMRRNLTRELSDIGGMAVNRDDLLRAAYCIDDIAGYTAGIAFRLSQVKTSTLKSARISKEIRELIDLAVGAVQRLNDVVRALTMNPLTAIEMSNDIQKAERATDDKYRDIVVLVLNHVKSTRDMIILKDIVERVEDMADSCLAASDSITILALGL